MGTRTGPIEGSAEKRTAKRTRAASFDGPLTNRALRPAIYVTRLIAGGVSIDLQDTFHRSRRVEQLLPAFPHLLPPHRAIETFACEQIFVAAALHNSSPFQHVNAIRVKDGGEPVRDQYRDGVAAHGHIPNGLADLFLRQRIKRRSRFDEHQQLRPAQKSARDREPLLFSSRNLHPAFANLRVEPVVGEGGVKVSGGEKQRLSIARAL